MKLSLLSFVLLAVTLGGCAGRTELFPNSDPALNRTPAEFAADAAKRHPYKSSAPRGGDAMAGAEVSYVLDRLDLVNISDTDWTDIEVWVNGKYVVYLPKLEAKLLKKIQFRAMFDENGQSFPLGNGKFTSREPVIVEKVELYRDGKLYNVKVSNPE